MIDFHCDTLLYHAQREFTGDLATDDGPSVNLQQLVDSGYQAQFFAIFLPPPEEFAQRHLDAFSDWQLVEACVRFLKDACQRQKKVAFATEANALEKDKVACYLTLEDGRLLTSFEAIDRAYAMGIRLVSLTWNGANALGYPQSTDPDTMHKGLTNFGKEAVAYMQNKGIIVDASHLSDGGFRDLSLLAKKPFMASHSNCRALAPHPRNLTDLMLHMLADRGGVCGLNFNPAFLAADLPTGSKAPSRIDDMVRHIKHMINIGGSGFPVLGSDFDGIEGDLEVSRPQDMPKLLDALNLAGLSAEAIENFAFKNARRFLYDTL